MTIGIFDSGVGGLTVARELRRQLPNHSLLYFGDTARVPYGDRTPEIVTSYAKECVNQLIDRGVEALVIACNTASAHALNAIQADIPIIGIIEPGVRAAQKATKNGKIGLIGTRGTISSKMYNRHLPDLHSIACPLLVPLIEEGRIDDEVVHRIAADYLAPLRESGVDTLILGCTHYPLIAPIIADLLPGVTLVDGAFECALEIKQLGLQESRGGIECLVTDNPNKFFVLGSEFLGHAPDKVERLPHTKYGDAHNRNQAEGGDPREGSRLDKLGVR